MERLEAVEKIEDIKPDYRNTPISLLLEYHNLGRSLDKCSQAALLIGMCMDNRKRLRLPDNFAYIIRAGGANLRYSEFQVSYAIAVGEVKALALIADPVNVHDGFYGDMVDVHDFPEGDDDLVLNVFPDMR